ncbi:MULTISPECIES: methyl-accepting chemotaxis protein [Marinomonas]|uniref:Methyl-accepting chemotaxis protein n=1 Tax=Marinomonas rhodophyticola TaxID=2992803 RepID=A0ABT3KJW5_9GAMM|nr:methyl-accepting chemotaxis protein [Marinomonas sp. KJ51-3]MCW4630843.1 methyl-accepting chemotaxis protein [Marinomonas sp. KJ51-3]
MIVNFTTATRLWLFAVIAILGSALIGISGVFTISSSGQTTHNNLETIQRQSNTLLAIENAKMNLLLQVKAFKDTLIRGNDPQSYEKYKAEFKQHRADVIHDFVVAKTLMQTLNVNTRNLDELAVLHTQLSDQYQIALDTFDPKDSAAGQKIDKMVKGIDRPALAAMDTLVETSEKQYSTLITEQLSFLDETSHTALNRSILICSVIVLLIVILALWINRHVMSQLGGDPAYAANIVKSISEGNLTTAIQLKSDDQTSLLAQMYKMQVALRQVIEQIRDASHSLVTSSQQLAASSHQVAVSSTQQSDTSTTISASVEELTYGISQVSGSADEAHQLSSNARDASSNGAKQLQQNIIDIKKIAKSIQEATQSIHKLGSQSEKIYSVIGVIQEIADQTNLLALNAAIEAARAGETGRGFAVVADEVRTLAEKTGQSTAEISNTINTIQRDTKLAIAVMESSASQMQPVIDGVDATGVAMREIEDSTRQVLTSLDQITLILAEQSKASNDVAQSVEESAQLNRSNSEAVHEVSNAAHHLKDIAQSLIISVQRFSI